MRFDPINSIIEYAIESSRDLGKKAQEMFFAEPWTPSVFLYIQTQNCQKTTQLSTQQSTQRMAQTLGLETQQVLSSLQALIDIGIVELKGRSYLARKGQHYFSPFVDNEIRDRLNAYWFGRSHELSKLAGLHKIEEHALSRKSFERISQWIEELRQKIREEIRTTEPEILCHIHWQLAKLEST